LIGILTFFGNNKKYMLPKNTQFLNWVILGKFGRNRYWYQSRRSWHWGICQEEGFLASSLDAQSCAGDNSRRLKWSAGRTVAQPTPSTVIQQHSFI